MKKTMIIFNCENLCDIYMLKLRNDWGDSRAAAFGSYILNHPNIPLGGRLNVNFTYI